MHRFFYFAGVVLLWAACLPGSGDKLSLDQVNAFCELTKQFRHLPIAVGQQLDEAIDEEAKAAKARKDSQKAVNRADAAAKKSEDAKKHAQDAKEAAKEAFEAADGAEVHLQAASELATELNGLVETHLSRLENILKDAETDGEDEHAREAAKECTGNATNVTSGTLLESKEKLEKAAGKEDYEELRYDTERAGSLLDDLKGAQLEVSSLQIKATNAEERATEAAAKAKAATPDLYDLTVGQAKAFCKLTEQLRGLLDTVSRHNVTVTEEVAKTASSKNRSDEAVKQAESAAGRNSDAAPHAKRAKEAGEEVSAAADEAQKAHEDSSRVVQNLRLLAKDKLSSYDRFLKNVGERASGKDAQNAAKECTDSAVDVKSEVVEKLNAAFEESTPGKPFQPVKDLFKKFSDNLKELEGAADVASKSRAKAEAAEKIVNESAAEAEIAAFDVKKLTLKQVNAFCGLAEQFRGLLNSVKKLEGQATHCATVAAAVKARSTETVKRVVAAAGKNASAKELAERAQAVEAEVTAAADKAQEAYAGVSGFVGNLTASRDEHLLVLEDVITGAKTSASCSCGIRAAKACTAAAEDVTAESLKEAKDTFRQDIPGDHYKELSDGAENVCGRLEELRSTAQRVSASRAAAQAAEERLNAIAEEAGVKPAEEEGGAAGGARHGAVGGVAAFFTVCCLALVGVL
ncbi:unnamed protein product [Trypanosoma congolense IL3000]|uniref:WGS project CAEQ00000000 data, annotated contig 602 n=1 Tax=Trypanosoma congolense (strain IL3000) TaxID=1068625 RepID=F9WH65_TRYCI|nr:unnamed protein product [Trypanosoma congolense IL3000]